jgi:hypothetical protein
MNTSAIQNLDIKRLDFIAEIKQKIRQAQYEGNEVRQCATDKSLFYILVMKKFGWNHYLQREKPYCC